jgi:prepilin-type processing-associated H-X9-DG protein
MIAIGDVDAAVERDFDPPPGPIILYDKVELRPTSVPGWIAAGIMADQPGNRVLKAWQVAIGIRHSGRWQILYCDGHVEKMRIQDLFNIRDQEVRKHWNRDHGPYTEIVLQIDPNWD